MSFLSIFLVFYPSELVINIINSICHSQTEIEPAEEEDDDGTGFRLRTRQGRDADDIIWVGNLDEEKNLIWDMNIKDYFFKYVPKGHKTIWVRSLNDKPIWEVVNQVCQVFAKLGKPEPLDTWESHNMDISFQGKQLNAFESL